jgi:hypothetical protein
MIAGPRSKPAMPAMPTRSAGATALVVACLACAAVAFTGGCMQKRLPVDFTETPRGYVSKDYERVYDRWTRHEVAYIDEDVALEIWATFKSWDFREAYIERYSAVYSLSEADEKALTEAQHGLVRAAYEFHFTAQATQYKWNDLEKANSPWRATLMDALGHELTPEYIKVVKLPDAYEESFFPSRTPFTKTYAIRFAVPADGSFAGTKSGSITLRFSSPIGRVELAWQGK